MCYMGRAVTAASLTLCGALLFSLPALGAGDPPPIPKPDPPPKSNPPPPPVAKPPVVQPVAPPPVAQTPVVPAVVHPTAAEQKAAARRAELKKARAAQARRAKKAEKVAAAQRRARALTQLSTGRNSSSAALPFLFVAFAVALIMLGLALTPAWAVPWSRASRALEDRRDELGVIGAMSLVATLIFFLLVRVTS